jgi:hypothetical protein
VLSSHINVSLTTDSGNAAPSPPIPQATRDFIWTWHNLKIEQPCKRSCFIYILDEQRKEPRSPSLLSEVKWSPEELQDFEFVSGVMPEASPCDLAIICRKPCQEVGQLLFSQSYSMITWVPGIRPMHPDDARNISCC